MCVVTELISLPGCPIQSHHEDCVYVIPEGKRRFFLDIPFSISIALEDNSNRTGIVGSYDNVVVIEKGRVALWRGN